METIKTAESAYVHLKTESFNEKYKTGKDPLSAYSENAIKRNYLEASAALEDRGISHFGDDISSDQCLAMLEEYQLIFANKQNDAIMKKIETSITKTVNSFKYGSAKLTSQKQSSATVFSDIASYLNALNDLTSEYNKIDENLMLYLATKKGGKIFIKPTSGLFSLSKDSTGRGAKALENIEKLKRQLQAISKGEASPTEDIIETIEKKVPAWMSIIKGDIEEGIDAIVSQEMFGFIDGLKGYSAISSIEGQDKIQMTGGVAKDIIREYGTKAEKFNQAVEGFTSKTDIVTAIKDESGREVGIIGNSIKSYKLKGGKNVTMSGSNLLTSMAIAGEVGSPFEEGYYNYLVHRTSEMVNAKGGDQILNRYLASKIGVFILSGYIGKTNVPPLFLTYVDKIVYLPEVLRQASTAKTKELFINVNSDSPVAAKGKNIFSPQGQYERNKNVVAQLRKTKITGGFRGKAFK